jgi:hypothetical protein
MVNAPHRPPAAAEGPQGGTETLDQLLVEGWLAPAERGG